MNLDDWDWLSVTTAAVGLIAVLLSIRILVTGRAPTSVRGSLAPRDAGRLLLWMGLGVALVPLGSLLGEHATDVPSMVAGFCVLLVGVAAFGTAIVQYRRAGSGRRARELEHRVPAYRLPER